MRLLDDLGRGSEGVDLARRGIEAASKAGDTHAAGELEDLLRELDA